MGLFFFFGLKISYMRLSPLMDPMKKHTHHALILNTFFFNFFFFFHTYHVENIHFFANYPIIDKREEIMSLFLLAQKNGNCAIKEAIL